MELKLRVRRNGWYPHGFVVLFLQQATAKPYVTHFFDELPASFLNMTQGNRTSGKESL
jgi:hypothetical protein